MMKHVLKRALSFALAVIMVFSLFPALETHVHAAGTLDTISGLTASWTDASNSKGKASWSANGTGITGNTTGYKNIMNRTVTSKLTLTNSSGEEATLSFSYALTGGGSVSGAISGTEGDYSSVLANGASISITLTSPSGAATNTLNLTGISLISTSAAPVTTTFMPATEGGSYTVGGTAISADTVKTEAAGTKYTLIATPASGYQFFGWYDETNSVYLDYNASYTHTADADRAIRPVFVSSTAALFGVGAARFYDLTEAGAAAAAGSTKTIILLNDGTVSGNHTIPAGTTLLVPFDASNTLYTTEPAHTNNNILDTASWVQPTAYRTLTLDANAMITVNGAISVSGKHYAQGGSVGAGAGAPTGPVGFIKMNTGSNITLNSGANLYAWGFITGSGSITAYSGAKVYENFQFRDFRGGGATTSMANDGIVFPMSQYYVQNIEVPTEYHYGAEEHVYTSLYISGSSYSAGVKFIGAGAMFQPESGCVLTKDYIESQDRLQLTVQGNASLANMSLSLAGTDIDSSTFILPINSNISIDILSGTTTLKQDVALLPGVELTIAQGAVLDLASGTGSSTISDGTGYNMFAYDLDEWSSGYNIDTFNPDDIASSEKTTGLKFVHQSYQVLPVRYAPGRTGTRAALVDAKIDINGTVITNGFLYTTENGANIISSDKTGVVAMNNGAGAELWTYQAAQEDTTPVYYAILTDSAQLKNGDGTYVQTSGATAGTVYNYCATCDAWVQQRTVSFDANGGSGTMEAQVIELPCCGETLTANDFTNGDLAFDSWNTANDGSGTKYADKATIKPAADVTLYAQWTEAHTCTWGTPTYTWAADYSTCTATVSCTDTSCNETDSEVVTAVVTTTAATCDEDGKTVYTATFTKLWATVQTEEVTIPATGEHAYEAGTYTWGTDNMSCSVVGTCSCGATATATANVTPSVKTASTCTVMGWTTYTATFTETWATTQTKDVQDIALADHIFGTKQSSQIRQDATCSGAASYYVQCDNCAAYTEDKYVTVGSPLGHDWSTEGTYEWTEDNASCTASRVCLRDNSHVDTAKATVSSQTTAATCGVDGKTIYTATFTETWAETQTAEKIIPATGNHNFTEEVTGTRVDATCIATGSVTMKCANCDAENVETLAIDADNHASTSVTYKNIDGSTHDVYHACCDVLITEKVNHTYDANGDCVCEARHPDVEILFVVDGVSAIQEVPYNEVPVFAGGTPVKAAVGCTTYTFAGWRVTADGEVLETLPVATVDAVYYAIFTEGTSHTNVVTDAAVDPGCETTGLTAGSHCAACNTVIEAQTTVDATGHTPGAAATCTTAQTCTKCGDVLEAAKGHAGGTATCMSGPVCSACGTTYGDKNPANHTGNNTTSVNAKAATCTEAGYTGNTVCECGVTVESGTTISALGHEYGETTYNFAEDGSSCTASHTCVREVNDGECGHEETANANISDQVTVAATCTENGTTTYYATFAETWAETQTKDVQDISATGHDWSVSYAWSEDGKSCTATRICGKDSNHVETETVEGVATEKTPATCEDMGWNTYTATFNVDWAEPQTNNVQDIPVLGHAWGETVEYVWATDHKSCTAVRTCTHDSDHKDEAEAVISSETTGATCGAAGKTVYTADFTVDWAIDQTKEVTIEPTGEHTYVAGEYVWNEDYTSCTVIGSCSCGVTAEAEATITPEVTTDATCVHVGVKTYTATFTESWAETQTKTEEIPATGIHSYDETTHICSVCGDVEEFTITWVIGDKSESKDYAYGSTVTPPTAPEGYSYVWYLNEEVVIFDNFTMPANNISISAKQYLQIELYWRNDAGDRAGADVEVGAAWEVAGTDRFSPEIEYAGHTFVGWTTDPNGTTAEYTVGQEVTFDEPTTLYGVWEKITYPISWDIDGDGTVDKTDSVAYGEMPEAPEASKASDGQFTYDFKAWDKEIVVATEAATYTATFYKTGFTTAESASGEIVYLLKDEIQKTGWTKIGDNWYYLDTASGYVATGVERVPYPTEAINGETYAPNAEDVAYAESKNIEFIDEDTSRFIFDEAGVFQYGANGFYDIGDGEKHWAVNGQLPWHVGLVEDNGDYYYFHGANVLATGDIYVGRNNTKLAVVIGGVYTFDKETGKLCNYNGITNVDGTLKYYVDAQLMCGAGLVKVGDNYIYVRTSGKLVVDGEYWVPQNNMGIAEGMYEFDENGYIIIPVVTVKNGVYKEDGGLFYYVNGQKTYAGLIQHSGELNGGNYTYEEDWIYVRSNGQLATGTYWVTKNNGAAYQGSYVFDENGVMNAVVTEPGDSTVNPEKNGVVEENGALYYYVDGKIAYGAGLVEIEEGKYIYVRSNGQLAVGEYWTTNHNGLLPEGLYDFVDGYYVVITEGTETVKNGVVDEDGVLYYYEDGELQYAAGLVEYNGGYIYVRSNGQLVTNQSYWITNHNDLLPEGTYEFDENGMLTI